ncbi:hypothetical protein F7734_05500 [Scytonema sp. UIC 10036]|uniref:dynamin family protein n=1 Tax=Scytonema sp. UIC 10036 TaxID=2304196 RepID=UPI0012DAB462|nr:dynamin family protein [Scytonema sp. UIC 10036]MUG91945.1 hypothetical protein [Scytonema sp. UIC 10036]
MMHSNLIDATRRDVLSLIDKQNELFRELLQIPGLLKESSEDGEQQRTDIQTVHNWQAILDNEIQKVDKLEMVLAVVGTMKAGKSTNINAIVGSQILPNRNQPMTSLPTLIRHRIGQKQPVLFFQKHEPIKNMVDEIRKKLVNLAENNQLNTVEMYTQNDGKQLVESLITGNFGQFQELYEGQEHIFQFLKFLNDLMRLSVDPSIGVEPPIEEYTRIDDLPSIEVEFFHLVNKKEVIEGSFALLDTPGPNELALGEKLRKVLSAQIARASAVLAIVDYTQLKSQAEGEIREELASQIEQTEDRLFIFVNKFDQQDENSMTEDEVKRYIAEIFMGGRVTQERVYPVSARYGYLANRALSEINQNGSLPDYKVHRWVADFGKQAIKYRWMQEIQKIDTVTTAAQQLWEESLFDQPIDEVVIKAAKTAALVSMQSATAKMLDFGNQLENFLELRRGALTKSVAEIRQLIDGFAQDIQEVEKAEAKAEKALEEVMENTLEAAQFKYENVKQLLKDALEAYFKEGKRLEESKLRERLKIIETEALQMRRNRDILNRIFRLFYNSLEEEYIQFMRREAVQRYRDFDPENPVIKFDEPVQAEALLVRVNEKISSIINDAAKELENALKNLSKGLEQRIPETIQEGVQNILKNAQERLQGEGFALQFEVSELNLERDEVDMAELLLSNLETSSRTIYKSGRREKKGILSRATRFFGEVFNKDWGYEDYIYSEEERIYIVDMRKIQKKVFESLDTSIQKLSKNHQIFFNQSLKPLIEKYFTNLKNYLEKFRGDLKDSIDNQRLDKETKQQLMQRILELKEQTELHTQDVQIIKQNLK